ncbi:MAG: leucyl aminopeptidase [Dehalococcoidia bacterium]|nr:leucyl aminopeptidase [Dehalococcoidia bacterium]
MQLDVTHGRLTQPPADTLLVALAEGERQLGGEAAAIDRTLGGAIGRALRDGLVAGKRTEFTVLPRAGRLRAKRVVVLGIGPRGQWTVDRLRARSGEAARQLRGAGAARVALAAQGLTAGLDPAAAGCALAEGLLLGLYRFDRHHTRAADRVSGSIEAVTLVAPSAHAAAALRRGVETGVVLAEATNFARDLANEPANLMTPSIMAGRALELAERTGMECKIIERLEAERLQMGSYLSVANGSVQPPKFIVLRYRGGRGGRCIALVGKGITFDTGGISLKPAANMEAMKGDMSGAAAVIAAMQAIARLQPRVNVLAIAPCTENMPGGSATKPGDVVYAMDGQSIEVINTDAEGRLVLADGLAYARAQGCTTLVDVATLTGAITTALGHLRAGVFANDDRLWGDLERAAGAAGERLWRMPLDEEYAEQIKSDVADMKNTGGAPAGSITAAKFLQRFAGDVPWAHLDIAGVMSSARDHGELVKGSTGAAVRTLVHFVLGRARG